MGEILGHKQDESKTRRAERERARPLLRAWLKAVGAKISAKRLGEFHGRLAGKLTNYPSANVGKVWPGQTRLAADLGKTARTVWAGLKDMGSEGLLIRKRGGPGKTSTYWFAIGGKKLFDIGAEDLAERGKVVDFPMRRRRNGKPRDSQELASPDSQEIANLDSQKIANKPLEQVYPLEPDPPLPPERTTAPSGETASGLARKEASQNAAMVGDVLSPSHVSFNDFWQASGMVGKIGPAMAAWNKLARSDQLEIAEMILGHGSIDTGGTWASTWLNTRAWELPAAPAIVADEPIAEDMQSVFREQGRKSSGPAMLSPYSPEWQAERARRVARHEPTHLMDDWAKRGISWPCV